MVAGLNLRGRIWKITVQTDDESGGAVLSGTVVHENVPARMQQQPEEQVLLQQGFETLKTFTMIVAPVTLDIEERYEWETTAPSNYYSAGKRYRIINHRPADFVPGDARNYVLLTLSRSEKSHSVQ